MESKVRLYEEELIALRSTRYTLDNIVGLSDSILSLQKEALSAASRNLPVLITGESGTGKELFAQGIHQASPRKHFPFVRINCSAIPRDLFESELFGYEKGAFTGAGQSGKPGKIELAHRGTLFLDEIGDLPPEMQPKLLRVLEEKEFERVGGTKTIKTDFRLLASTNQNLEKMMGEGRFRKDLFYRLNVLPLNIPALRERREDIIPLARHIITQIAQEPFLLEAEIDKPAEAALVRYDWPGNVRELANVMERVLAALEGKTIHLCDLPFYLYESRKEPSQSRGALLKRTQESAEKEAIRYTLESTSYNKAQAADLLGIHRTVLYRKMKRFGLPLHPD
jgi:transcriptional regulator with PAS, ATPase and Fis domain